MQYDIFKLTEDTTEIGVQGGKIAWVKSKKIEKSSARIFKGGCVFSSSVVGSISSAQLLEAADRKGNVGIVYDYDLPQTKEINSVEKMSESREQGVRKYRQFLDLILRKYPHLNWSGSVRFRRSLTQFSSSYTGNLSSDGESFDLFLLCKSFGSTEYAEGYVHLVGNEYGFMNSFQNFERIIDVVTKKVVLESKKMPVLILESEDILDRLASDIQPEKFHGDGSFLSGKLGQMVFHEDISIQDVGFDPTRGCFTKFDGEGVLHQCLGIVEKGIFSNVLYDLRQGKKYQVASTGNGFREYNSGVKCRSSGLFFKPGSTPIWEMLQSVPECLIVVMGYGGAVNEQWEYSTPVQVGILCKKGRPVGRVPALSIKGQMGQFLGKDFLGVSSDGYLPGGSPVVLTQLEVIVH